MPDCAIYVAGECPPCRLRNAIFAEVSPSDYVLDVGCGFAGYGPALCVRLREGGQLTVLDAHAPYLLTARWPQEVVKIAGEATDALTLLGDDVFSVAMAIDMPEHLKVSNVARLLGGMRRVARKVIWFVPLGAHPQHVDHYRMGADKWQTHRSWWSINADSARLDASASPIIEAQNYDDNGVLSLRPDRTIVFSDFHAHGHPEAPGAAILIWGA
jgi:hypothetical protein